MNDRLNLQHWLDAGLRTLAEEGPQGLRIMALAQQLGVTKGSFYWHYRDLDDYQAALLREWEQRHTQQIIRAVEDQGGTPSARLRNLLGLTVNADARLALAIRRWAASHAPAREAQARVDADRVAYVAGLLVPLGWPAEQAQFLARWTYGALIGYFNLQGPTVTPGQMDLLLATLTPPAAAAA